VMDIRRRLGGQRSRRRSFAGPAHSDNRMTLAIYTHAKVAMEDSTRAALEEILSRSGC
jgi:hypothetical protein